jgi:hypothetical protein
MTKKHVGGRGRKASHKHQTFSVSLPPHLKELLDSWTSEEVSRSELIGQFVQAHAIALAAPATPAQATATPQPHRKSRNRPQTGNRGKTTRLALTAPVLHVLVTTVPRGKGWKPEKYEAAERLLRQGDTLTADGVDYRTQEGEIMSWRTAEALVGFKILKLL